MSSDQRAGSPTANADAGELDGGPGVPEEEHNQGRQRAGGTSATLTNHGKRPDPYSDPASDLPVQLRLVPKFVPNVAFWPA
jgi:hypothetical protein